MHTEQHHATGRWMATSIFKRRPETVACARSWATDVYVAAGGLLPDVCELLVSEAATNAVLHGGGSEYRVSVRYDLAIEVWDASPVEPKRRHANNEAISGRGLELLEALAPGYTVTPEQGGKSVCFELKGG
ncbi:ATP-binding protein [Streptomyces sp. NPDC014622]|uniref:ATP-binding protein n=2 Tax=Streptomyces TaxID=1883 RepID=UPI0036FA3C37